MTFSDPVDTQVSGPGPVPVRTEEPTIGALVHDLSQQLPDLIRSELRLAQASPPRPERAIEGVKEDIATVKGARR
jgi:hypothetical protein